MTAAVEVRSASKVFALAESGSGPVSLWAALQAGKRETKTREVWALRDISFSIGRGERVGIIGRNGAGKTTLVSLLAGITNPTFGDVAVTGSVHAMLTIGTVLRDEASGRENIYLDGAIHGRSREEIDARVEEIIKFAELGEFIDRPVRTYSSGMKGRLAFAMSAFVEKDILIIDETLSVGDAVFSRKASSKMRKLAAQGQIVIAVSHDLSSIVDICNRCLWLDGGRLVMDGRPSDVTKAYAEAVDEADETELSMKFRAPEPIKRRSEFGSIENVAVMQKDAPVGATAKAFAPLSVIVEGSISKTQGAADLELRLMRVDGKTLWRERLSRHGGGLPDRGHFKVTVSLDPFVLGAHLYRLTALLVDDGGAIDAQVKVFEVVDAEGQIGGRPMLYHPVYCAVRQLGESNL